MKSAVSAVLVVAISLISDVVSAERPKLRVDAAEAIAKRDGKIPVADRVEVYVTRLRRGVDQRSSVPSLKQLKPDVVLTNKSEINQLFARLRPKGDEGVSGRLASRDGRTYHLLAFNQDEGTVTHIRIFDSDSPNATDAEIYLRPGSSFRYLNDKIGPWLRANVALNEERANAPPETP